MWGDATQINGAVRQTDQFARLTATSRVLTGALRARLSLKYRRQFGGWFGCPIHLYHHRSVTYGLSPLPCLASTLFSALYPFYFTSRTLLRSILLQVSLPWPPCLRPTIRTLTKLHPLLSPFFLSYSFASLPPTSRAKSNPTYSFSNLSLRVVFFVSWPQFILSSLWRSVRSIAAHFFR